MRNRLIILGLLLAAASSARAGNSAYALCGTYDSYILVYKSTATFEELGKLRCGEKVEILNRWNGYAKIQTLDNRIGWVRDPDLSATPPPPRRSFSFGMTDIPKRTPIFAKPLDMRPPLTNRDVFEMVAKHQPPNDIAATILASRCNFDTSLASIRRLKMAGTSDKVILAMMAVPVDSEITRAKIPGSLQVEIPDGTPVGVLLNENVPSERMMTGTVIEMTVAEDVVVDGVTVFARGTAARARIIGIKPTGVFGHEGEVAWFMQDVVAIDGEHVPITFAASQTGSAPPRNFEGFTYFSSPYHKGGPAIPGSGETLEAVVRGDTLLSIPAAIAGELTAQRKPQDVPAGPAAQADPPSAALPAPSAEVKP